MRKIRTIFVRDIEGNRKVINDYIIPIEKISACIATEKLDGTNVRVTIRNEGVVRLEKRRNPTNIQKQKGIIEPWYIDAYEHEKADKYIFEAVKCTDFKGVEDGEWSGEALGPKIQANPLNLENHIIFLFSHPSWREKITFKDTPVTYQELIEWLPKQKSFIGNDCGIEGIVWHNESTGEMYKIKCKDFPTLSV